MTKKWSHAISILCCYASKDRVLYDELNKHLVSLKRLEHIAMWFDGEVQENTISVNKVRRMLRWSSITLLLISSDFMASNCCNILLEEAVKMSSTRIIPIILRPVDCEDTPITQLQMLPSGAKPITTWSNRDEAFLDVVRGIRRAMATILTKNMDSIKLFRQHTSVPSLVKEIRAKEQEEGEQAEVTANEILLFCEQGISLDPYNVIFYKIKIEILLKTDSENLLLKRLCEEAIQKFPEEKYFRNVRSQLYLDDLGYLLRSQSFPDLSQSLEECKRMLQINPAHLDLYIYRAHILYELERYNEAITAYEQIFTLSSKVDKDIYYYLGEALYATGQFEEAIKNFNLYISEFFQYFGTKPSLGIIDATAYVKKGQAMSALGRRKEASIAYKQAKKISPTIDLSTQKKDHPLISRMLGKMIFSSYW